MQPLGELTPLGTEGLAYVDVLPGTPPDALSHLCDIHLLHFSDSYAEATRDFERAWRGGPPPLGIIEHQWLLFLDGVPCGELVFAINLNRRAVCRHFTSVRKEFRSRMPYDWIPTATRAVVERCRSEASSLDVDLLGMMSEILPKHVAGWRRLGLFQPDIGYQEPVHGNYWREFGPLEFTPMVANILPFPAGREAGLGAIADAGVRAFLLDYYGVPESDPTFQGIIQRCADIPPAW
ncbi:MAG: hypothetical protein ACKOYQ_02570 [Actinomycetota bacterium]